MSRASPRLQRRPRTILSTLTAVLLFAAAGLVPAGALASGGAATSAQLTSATTLVSLTVSSALAFTPVNPSSPTLAVEFEIRNSDTQDHTFTISSRVNVTAPAGSSPDNTLGQWFDSAHVLIDMPVPAGQTVFANATFATAGTYQFICRYHYPSMQGSVSVGVPASSSSSPSYLLYGATGAIVLIVVIVATVSVLGRRKSKASQPPTPPP